MQHLNTATSFHKYLTNELIPYYDSVIDSAIDNQLLCILFQIYAPLAMLSNNFTHYDLHTKNVLLYKLNKNQYIEYHYHNKNNVYIMKCNMMAKIIDYGRCYFYKDHLHNSKIISTQICDEAKCDPECGINVGYNFLTEKSPSKIIQHFYISSQQNNISHDLRLLYIIKQITKIARLKGRTLNIINKVKYDTDYGTAEIKTKTKNEINNVVDAYNEFKTELINPLFITENNNMYMGQQKMGELHVYLNDIPGIYLKPMHYINLL